MHFRILAAAAILLYTLRYSHAQNLNGTVRDSNNKPVPYASVSVQNTKQGVITNLNGDFTLYLASGSYTLITQCMGYTSTYSSIQISNEVQNVKITLNEASQEIGTVVVNKDRRDLAKQLIQKAQKRREINEASLNTFTANYYCKNTLETGNPFIINADSVANDRENVYFQETYSKLYFKTKDRFKEERLAYRDYQFKEYVRPNSSMAFSINNSRFDRGDYYDKQALPGNPLHLLHQRQEADFNLYQNTLSIPTFSETPYTSPIGQTALLVYNFDLISSFYQGDQKLYEVKVWPKFEQSNLLSGTLYIEDISYAVVSAKLEFPSGSLHFLKKFNLVQNYVRIDSSYVLDNEEYIYHAKQEKNEFAYGNTLVQYSQYRLNEEIDNSFMNKGQSVYVEGADSMSSDFWDQVRPHTLKPKELDFIEEQDSIITYRNSPAFLREQDSLVNEIKWYNFVFIGVSHINRSKGMTYYFLPIIMSVRPFQVGGYRHALGGTVEKKWENKKTLLTNYEANYGFRNKNVKGELSLDYTFNPKKSTAFIIRGGDNYDLLNNDESIVATFSRGNYLRKVNAGIGVRHELVNGLLAQFWADYITFQSIQNIELAPWSDRVFGSYNVPKDFPGYSQVLLNMNLTWWPKMQYVETKYEKISKGSKYPKFQLEYRKGVKPFFGSDVNYDFMQLSVKQSIKTGTLGTSKYNLSSGRFLNDREIRIADQKFFRSSDKYFFSNPLYTFQYLDTSLRTTQAYLQAQYLHQFNGAIMNKIPLLNRLHLQSFGGAGALLLEQSGYKHTEIFAGLSKAFTIRDQMFKISAVYVSSVNSVTGYQDGFKIGFDFFDSWSNGWDY